jgi:Arc/MetJ-type ribon-helix-helix transcriptional regulator
MIAQSLIVRRVGEAIPHQRPAPRRLGKKRKATFLLPVRLLQEIDDAVVAGATASKNDFVEAALERAVDDLRRAKRRVHLQEAMLDPLFRQDVDDMERDFRFANAETADESV